MNFLNSLRDHHGSSDHTSRITTLWAPRQYIKKQRHYFANKGPSSQGYGFSSSHVWMCELNHKESWELKNWCFWIVVLEKTLESPLNCKEINPVNPKGNQSWIFIGRADAEAELQYFGHLMQRTDSLEKTLMLGKIEGRRRRGWQRMRWLNGWLDGHEFEQPTGVGDGQGNLECYSPWGHRVGQDWVNWSIMTDKNRFTIKAFKNLCILTCKIFKCENIMEQQKLWETKFVTQDVLHFFGVCIT